MIIVTGGDGGLSSAELLHSNGTRLCSLPDLPDERRVHSQTGLITCGGGSGATQKSCITFSSGTWQESHTLTENRYGHTQWSSPDGVLLIGGYGVSSGTTELLTDNGDSTPAFNPGYEIKYDINRCLIFEFTPGIISGMFAPFRTSKKW